MSICFRIQFDKKTVQVFFKIVLKFMELLCYVLSLAVAKPAFPNIF